MARLHQCVSGVSRRYTLITLSIGVLIGSDFPRRWGGCASLPVARTRATVKAVHTINFNLTPMASSLKFKQDETTPVENRCPSCGASLVEGAVICVQCGYDFRSGRRVDEEAAPRMNPLVIAGVALLVAVAAGLVAWRMLTAEPPAAPIASLPPSTPVVADVAPAVPTPVAPTQVIAVVAETQGVAVVEAPVAETNQVPEEPALDPAVVEAEQRVAVIEQLDIKAPMFNAGETVELRYTNGVVQRGVFVSSQEEGLTLQTGSNQTRAVDFVLLDRASRVRSDPQYRERYIEFHTQQRTQKILQQEMAPPEAP